MEALTRDHDEAVTLRRGLLNRVRAAEEMLLPVVRAIVDRELCPGGDCFEGPNKGLIGVYVPTYLRIGTVSESIVNAPAPAVSECRVGV